ncbi:SMP-30/gluconolactonase/LRE family protein [Actinophytocola oryzae]|uniref:Sugar lactone lactonase YvrE n=1 Tax=Actinophytocola oryzae TaxID=502181 RepID=A0A4R7UTU2_9PSEU|nr:SMP-30/gluconolactonase/LRE family protein [Actinophytocola oryzae]TDV38562.1 sugar lactone lactonase YvrE [Actinophytocola oryzae]
MTVEVAVPARARVGEGPHWDERENCLYWVDILAGHIHTTTLSDGVTRTVRLPTLVGAAVPRLRGGFVAATASGFAEVDTDGTYRPRHDLLSEHHRMNDAKCDPRGRLWAGSTHVDFEAGRGALHVLDTDWRTHVVLDGLTLPNGMGWSQDGREFYLIDSIERQVLAFDVDLDTAELGARRVVTTFPGDAGLPDGMCVDAEGTLWIAMWGGHELRRIDRHGRTLTHVPVPVEQPSSCAFGGANLFVTSASEDLDIPADTPDGSVLRVTGLGVTGTPGVAFAG